MSAKTMSFAFPGPLPMEAKEGIDRAFRNADPRWKKEMVGAIRQVALAHETFTCDEIVSELERNHYCWETHTPNARTGMIRDVISELKWLYPTDEWRRSKRKQSHGNKLKVYRSSIYRAAVGAQVPIQRSDE